MSYELAEIDRRLGNILRVGTVAQLDAAAALVTVDLGEQITTWLPWFAGRAGKDTSWHPPEPGEQVMVLSPSGELSQGVVLPAIYSDAHPQNGGSADQHRVTYGDGTVVTYDRAAHKLTVDASAASGQVVVNAGSGTVTVNCSSATVNADASVTLNTPQTNCKGALTVDGKITGKGGMAVSGGAGAAVSVAGTMNVSGGDITADGISLKQHTHKEQGDGANTSAAQ